MTNPDTNTLNGALEQLGITMADNLVTMGVSDADPSDGLTTLAGKILEIAPVPPTPTPASIDLTGTKSILSYADSESCVLTATVLDENDGPVEGATVNLYNGSTLWDTLTTDSSGECTKTYSSAGSGDITFTAEVDGTLLTKTYDIEDCMFYDDATTDNTSKYTTSAISSFTQDTDHYIATKTMASASATNYYAHLYPTNIADLPSDYEFSIDLKVSSKGSDFQSGLQVSDSHITTYQYMNELSNLLRQSDLGIFYRVNGTLTRYTGTHTLSTSVWYRLTFKVEGTSVNAVITNLDSSSVVFSETKTLSNVTGWHKSQLALGGQTQTLHFKNCKVKPL